MSLYSDDCPSTMERRIQSELARIISTFKIHERKIDAEEAFFIADLGQVYRQYFRWKNILPGIKPFYAVKCNPDLQVIHVLAALGCGFDCASKNEMDLVLQAGVLSSEILYANPVKASSHIRYARTKDIRTMTFDNTIELDKIAREAPDARLILRIATFGALGTSKINLSKKYGASLRDTLRILAHANRLGLEVIGVSFHVGSAVLDPSIYRQAINDARHVFDQGVQIGYKFSVLDIGGGFTDELFEAIAMVVQRAIDHYFPDTMNIRVIAEPGRYFAASAFTLVANVIGRRQGSEEPEQDMLYLSDGIYGNMSCVTYENIVPEPHLHRSNRTAHKENSICENEATREYSLWGPTCDSLDCISSSCRLPASVDVGDWLYFLNMGAYSSSISSTFNGLSADHKVFYYCSEPVRFMNSDRLKEVPDV